MTKSKIFSCIPLYPLRACPFTQLIGVKKFCRDDNKILLKRHPHLNWVLFCLLFRVNFICINFSWMGLLFKTYLFIVYTNTVLHLFDCSMGFLIRLATPYPRPIFENRYHVPLFNPLYACLHLANICLKLCAIIWVIIIGCIFTWSIAWVIFSLFSLWSYTLVNIFKSLQTVG